MNLDHNSNEDIQSTVIELCNINASCSCEIDTVTNDDLQILKKMYKDYTKDFGLISKHNYMSLILRSEANLSKNPNFHEIKKLMKCDIGAGVILLDRFLDDNVDKVNKNISNSINI